MFHVPLWESMLVGTREAIWLGSTSHTNDVARGSCSISDLAYRGTWNKRARSFHSVEQTCGTFVGREHLPFGCGTFVFDRPTTLVAVFHRCSIGDKSIRERPTAQCSPMADEEVNEDDEGSSLGRGRYEENLEESAVANTSQDNGESERLPSQEELGATEKKALGGSLALTNSRERTKRTSRDTLRLSAAAILSS